MRRKTRGVVWTSGVDNAQLVVCIETNAKIERQIVVGRQVTAGLHVVRHEWEWQSVEGLLVEKNLAVIVEKGRFKDGCELRGVDVTEWRGGGGTVVGSQDTCCSATNVVVGGGVRLSSPFPGSVERDVLNGGRDLWVPLEAVLVVCPDVVVVRGDCHYTQKSECCDEQHVKLLVT